MGINVTPLWQTRRRQLYSTVRSRGSAPRRVTPGATSTAQIMDMAAPPKWQPVDNRQTPPRALQPPAQAGGAARYQDKRPHISYSVKVLTGRTWSRSRTCAGTRQRGVSNDVCTEAASSLCKTTYLNLSSKRVGIRTMKAHVRKALQQRLAHWQQHFQM